MVHQHSTTTPRTFQQASRNPALRKNKKGCCSSWEEAPRPVLCCTWARVGRPVSASTVTRVTTRHLNAAVFQPIRYPLLPPSVVGECAGGDGEKQNACGAQPHESSGHGKRIVRTREQTNKKSGLPFRVHSFFVTPLSLITRSSHTLKTGPSSKLDCSSTRSNMGSCGIISSSALFHVSVAVLALSQPSNTRALKGGLPGGVA